MLKLLLMKKTEIFTFLGCFFICVFLFLFYLHKKTKFNTNYNNCLKSLELYKQELYSRDKKLENQLFSEYLFIDSSIIVSDIRGNEISIRKLINSPKLVYSFTEMSCIACVKDDIETLNLLGDKIGSNNIIIISRFDDLKKLKIFAMQNVSKSKYYNLISMFKISIENTEHESPFFFIISSDLKTKFAHITIPGDSIEHYYFKRIIQFFNCNIVEQ